MNSRSILAPLLLCLTWVAPSTIVRADGFDAIPLRFAPSGLTLVTCSFGEITVPFGCVFDLGNGNYEPFMPEEAIARLSSLPDADSLPARFRMCPAKKLDSVKIGGQSMPTKWVYACSPGMGLGNVGVEFLEGGIWKLDLAEGSLLRIDAIPPELKRRELVREGGHLVVAASIGRRNFKAVLDTGAALTTFDKAFVRTVPDGFRIEAGNEGWTGPAVYERRSSVRIGDLDRKAGEKVVVLAMTGDAQYGDVKRSGAVAVLGMSTMRNVVWYLDLRTNAWAVKAAP